MALNKYINLFISFSFSFRLEFITSYSKGHATMEVATGLTDGAKLLNLFGAARKKKFFLYLPSGNTLI